MKIQKKIMPERNEIPPTVWLQTAFDFGNLFESNGVRYAIFGAGALAAHNVMIRPTVDVDYVVNDYQRAISLLQARPDVESKNLQKERDGIQVADFYFKSGVTVQIWDNNLYSLPMTDDSWSHVVLLPIPGYGAIKSISMEDLIVSKVGQYTQRLGDDKHEANKNLNDICAAIHVLSNPDLQYVIKRLSEGARRENVLHSSMTHLLNWYFVREVEAYKKSSDVLDSNRIRKFVSKVLVTSRSQAIEYYLLHNLRKNGILSKFQTDFMLDDKSLLTLLKRWKSILKVDGDRVHISAKAIQHYVETLPAETMSDYAKQIIFSGKNPP